MKNKTTVFLLLAVLLGFGCGEGELSPNNQGGNDKSIVSGEAQAQDTTTLLSAEVMDQSRKEEEEKKEALEQYIKEKQKESPNKGKSCETLLVDLEGFLKTAPPSTEIQKTQAFNEALKTRYEDIFMQECLRKVQDFESRLDSLIDLYL
jgi:hypothetical protein